MKLDKETMIKHRFWFLLPLIAIFLLVCWICILVVRGEASENYTKAKNKNDELVRIAGQKDLKNNNWINSMKVELSVSDKVKDGLWYAEFDRQNRSVRDAKDPLKGTLLARQRPFIIWPPKTTAQWERLNPGKKLAEMDFMEPLGNVPQDEYKEEYPIQYSEVVDIIKDWLNESNPAKLEGAVRVRGGSGNHRNAVLPNLLRPQGLGSSLVLSHEAHLLQEDIAARREIFQGIADLLDSYSKLKPEWDEVPMTEVKVTTSNPAAPAPAPTAEVTAPMATTAKGGSGQEPQRETFQAKRFYNYIWTNFLDTRQVEQNPKLKSSVISHSLPMLETYMGWRLDLSVAQDAKDEKKLVLHAVSANHSDKFTLPAIPLAVWFTEVGTDRELPNPLVIEDAGGLPPSEYWPTGELKRVSEKSAKEIPLPGGYGKIKRVGRVVPAGTKDQFIGFNHDWLVHARLVQPSNRPTLNLVGQIINRSGRRLPVANFTVSLTQPNSPTGMMEEIAVSTDAFYAGEKQNFFKEINSPIRPDGMEFIKQKLTWRTTPIKRIELLEFGARAHAHSDRMKVLQLTSYDVKKKDYRPGSAAEATPASTSNAPASSANQMGPGDMPTLGQQGNMSSGAGGGSSDPVSENHNIRLKRYLQVTPNLRRIPVALVMTVDATAMTDIVGAMANSRLRFQVTMAPWTRVANLGKPGGSGGGAAAAPPRQGAAPNAPPGAGKGAGGGAMPPAVGPEGGNVGRGAAPGGNVGQPPAGAAPAARNVGLEDDSSVVELQIYGVITVYESPDAEKRIKELKEKALVAESTAAAPAKQ